MQSFMRQWNMGPRMRLPRWSLWWPDRGHQLLGPSQLVCWEVLCWAVASEPRKSWLRALQGLSVGPDRVSDRGVKRSLGSQRLTAGRRSTRNCQQHERQDMSLYAPSGRTPQMHHSTFERQKSYIQTQHAQGKCPELDLTSITSRSSRKQGWRWCCLTSQIRQCCRLTSNVCRHNRIRLLANGYSLRRR